MDTRSELAWERAALAKADLDLQQGTMRVNSQEGIVAELEAKGIEMHEAERLLQLLRHTLFQWEQHRTLIVQRIAYLQAKLAEAERASAASIGNSPALSP